MKKLLWLGIALLVASACKSSPIHDLVLYNLTDSPIYVKREKSRTSETAPGGHFQLRSVRVGETLEIRQGDKTLETLTVGQSPLDLSAEKDEKMLYVVGGPAPLAVADYSDFYTPEGQQDKAHPKIRDIQDLREKKTLRLKRSDVLMFAGGEMNEKVYSWSEESRLLRVVKTEPGLEPDKLEEFLDYELRHAVGKMKETE